MSDELDAYRSLPPDLTAVLRDPSVLLPGELELFEHIHSWSAAPALAPDTRTIVELVRHQAAGSTWLGGREPESLTSVTVAS